MVFWKYWREKQTIKTGKEDLNKGNYKLPMWKFKNPVDKWNRLHHHWKEKKLEHIYILRNYTGYSIGRKNDGYFEQWIKKYGTEWEGPTYI